MIGALFFMSCAGDRKADKKKQTFYQLLVTLGIFYMVGDRVKEGRSMEGCMLYHSQRKKLVNSAVKSAKNQ